MTKQEMMDAINARRTTNEDKGSKGLSLETIISLSDYEQRTYGEMYEIYVKL